MAGVKLSNPLVKVMKSLRKPRSSGNSHWPSRVLDTLETKYHLRPEEMLRLWYIRERVSGGKYGKESLLIYDRMQALEQQVSIKNSSDLYTNTDLLLFTGNLFWDGSVRLEKVGGSQNN